jgi:epsilon-lactone hydrolase
VAARLRDAGFALPGAILSVSPWYDMELKNATIEQHAATDRLLSREVLEWFRGAWLSDTGVAYDDPRVNMLYADLSGLPPINVFYGEAEVLAGEAIEFTRRASDAGVDVALNSVPGGQHSFILGAGRVPEVDEAILKMGRWLRSKLRVASRIHSMREWRSDTRAIRD